MDISVTIPHTLFLEGWLMGNSLCCSGGGIQTKSYRKASNNVRKNCTAATGDDEINFSKAVSLIGSEKSASLNVSLQFSIEALKPLSVAGNAKFDVDGFANRIAKQ
jgi:hypothetical protein